MKDKLCLDPVSVWFSEADKDQAKEQGKARVMPF